MHFWPLPLPLLPPRINSIYDGGGRSDRGRDDDKVSAPVVLSHRSMNKISTFLLRLSETENDRETISHLTRSSIQRRLENFSSAFPRSRHRSVMAVAKVWTVLQVRAMLFSPLLGVFLPAAVLYAQRLCLACLRIHGMGQANAQDKYSQGRAVLKIISVLYSRKKVRGIGNCRKRVLFLRKERAMRKRRKV